MLDWMADMTRMGRTGLIVAAVSALALWGAAAQASVLNFTYTFRDSNTFGDRKGDNQTISVMAEGVLGADKNTFTVSKVDQVYGNGKAVFSDPNQIVLAPSGNILSLNGVGISFTVNSTDYQTNVGISGPSVYGGSGSISTYGSMLPYEPSATFFPGDYTASVTSAVPEPATVGLLGLMVLGFGVMRRGFGHS